MPKDRPSNLCWRIAAPLLGLALSAAPGIGTADPGPSARRIERASPAAAPGTGMPPTIPAPAPPGPPLDLWTFELEEQAPEPVAPNLPTQATPPAPDTARAAAAASGDPVAPPAAPGSVRLAYDSLIHRDVERRGTAASWALGTGTQFKGFLLAPTPPDGQGVTPGNNADRYRLHGVLVEHDLVLRHQATLQLIGSWLAGAEQPGHAARGRPAGSAWSLGGRASLLAERLRLSFEYAGSRPTSEETLGSADAAGAAASADGVGQAYAATAEFRADPRDGHSWHLGTEYRWIGPRFDGIANPTLHKDRQHLRTFGGVAFGDWRLEMGVEQERDNLRQDPDAPTVHRDKYEISANWQPAVPDIAALVGRPRIRLAADLEHSRRRPDGASDGAHPSRRGRRIRLESEFDTPHWRWGIAAVGGIATEWADARPGVVRTTKLRMYGDPQTEAALPLRPALSWQRRGDDASGAAGDSWRAELATRPLALRDDLRAKLRLGYQQRGLPDLGRTEEAVKIGASLIWTLQRPTEGHRGLALAVTGSVGSDTRDAAGDAQGDYGLALSLSTGNPLAGW